MSVQSFLDFCDCNLRLPCNFVVVLLLLGRHLPPLVLYNLFQPVWRRIEVIPEYLILYLFLENRKSRWHMRRLIRHLLVYVEKFLLESSLPSHHVRPGCHGGLKGWNWLHILLSERILSKLTWFGRTCLSLMVEPERCLVFVSLCI